MLEVRLRKLITPILIICVGNRELVRPEDVERFRRIAPHAVADEVSDIGHMLTGGANNAHTTFIAEFLGCTYA